MLYACVNKGLIICVIIGAQLTTVDDEVMSIFAPSQTVMDEVLERVDVLMNTPDPEVREQIDKQVIK